MPSTTSSRAVSRIRDVADRSTETGDVVDPNLRCGLPCLVLTLLQFMKSGRQHPLHGLLLRTKAADRRVLWQPVLQNCSEFRRFFRFLLGFQSKYSSNRMKLAGLKSIENAHDESVWSATWVPGTDSRPSLLLTGSLDETVKIWKPDELDLERTNTGHCLGVVSVAAHPSGYIAASASLDSFVRVFDVDSNATIATLEAPPSEVWQMRFNPEGTILAVAGGGSASVKLWDTATWKLFATLSIPRPEGPKPADKSGSKKFVLSVAWSLDGRRLACGSMDGTISIFDVPRAKFLHHLEGHFMPVRSLIYSPVEPRLLFSASDDAHVHMYDAEGKALIGAMSGHGSWVLSIDVSPDGAAVATGSSDRTVRLWDLNMRAAVQTMSNHNDQVWGVAFRPVGGLGVRAGRLASVSDDKSISLYDYS